MPGTSKAIQIIKEALAASGLPPPNDFADCSRQSVRVGAAQDLLCAGFDTATIMRAGGWKSANVLGHNLERAEHNIWS